MASILRFRKAWRAYVFDANGKRLSKVFALKQEAQVWAAQQEVDIHAGKSSLPGKIYTLRDALTKYVDEVSSNKKGARWERVRINKWLNSKTLPVDIPLADITTPQLAAWRDASLRRVSAGSVLREINLLSSVLNMARREWQWIDVNPLSDVRRPASPPHRERTLSAHEVKMLLRQMDYHPAGHVKTTSQRVAVAMLLALRTAMRTSELTGLTWDRIKAGYCRLPETKNGTARDVPLTVKASRLLDKLRRDAGPVFGVTSANLGMVFRQARDGAGLDDVHFHDTRHTACTWLARKVDMLTLCKICGWRDAKNALIYYNPRAADIARQLDGERV